MDAQAARNELWQGAWPAYPRTVVHQTVPSMAEQLGTDPTSKLAAAIHDLANAIRSTQEPTPCPD